MRNFEDDGKDVAETDQIVSGTAGTGQENRNGGVTLENPGGEYLSHGPGKPGGASPASQCRQSPPEAGRNREVIGLGVLYNGAMNAGTVPDTAHCAVNNGPEDPPEGYGDLIFSLYERLERIADRLNKKIARLDRRLTKIEKRRRS